MGSLPSIDWLSRRRWVLIAFGSAPSAARQSMVAALALTSLLIVGGLSWYGYAIEATSASLKAQLDATALQAVPAEANRHQSLSPAERQAAFEVVRRLNVDWAGLLDELERMTSSEIVVLEIEPKPVQGALRLTVEARSAGIVLSYLNGLNSSNRFRNARALKHDTNEQDVNRPLRFVLIVEMGPNT